MTRPPPAPFVVGVGRSGTTLLRLMLDAHPALAIPGETHFVPALIDVVAETGDPVRALEVVTGSPTWPNLALDAAALARAFDAIDPFTPGEAVRAVFRLYAERFGKPRWGDKTPTYRASMPAIAAALPEAAFVHIIRDGRDVALSYRGLWFGPGDDLAAQARFWVGEIGRARVEGTRTPRYLEVRYEALVTRPEATLRTLCEALELEFHPAMLSYDAGAAGRLSEYVHSFGPQGAGGVSRERFLAIHDRTHAPPDPGRIGRWRSEMSPAEREVYEAVAGPLLDEMGYRDG